MWLVAAALPQSGPLKTLSHPSPNFGPRKGGAKPSLIVIHYTAMDSCDAACATLRDPDTEVSAHYLISGAGDVRSLVAEDMRAWHAGAGAWRGITDVNSHSIGIELANDGFSPFAAAQMDALEGLLRGMMGRWSIPPEGVIGHSDLAPGRKIDPGQRFDWQRLARQGLVDWYGDLTPARDDFAALARAYGYTADVADDVLLAAFRLRFRPWADGALDETDSAILQSLVDRRAAIA